MKAQADTKRGTLVIERVGVNSSRVRVIPCWYPSKLVLVSARVGVNWNGCQLELVLYPFKLISFRVGAVKNPAVCVIIRPARVSVGTPTGTTREYQMSTLQEQTILLRNTDDTRQDHIVR